jgi:hypothetical protein
VYFLTEILPLYVLGAITYGLVMPRIIRNHHNEE